MPLDPSHEYPGQSNPWDALSGAWRGIFGGGGGQAAAEPPPAAAAPTGPVLGPPAPDEPDPYEQAQIAKMNADAAAAQALADQRRAELAKADSPEAQAKARADLLTAETQAATAAIQLNRALTALPPEQQARLENDLAIQRDALQAKYARDLAEMREAGENVRTVAQLQQARELAELREGGETGRQRERIGFEREEGALGRQSALELAGMREAGETTRLGTRIGFEREEGALNRQQRMAEAAMQGGISLREQALAQQRAQDDFVLRSMANRIAKGELDVNRASKLFDAYLARAKLPLEIYQTRAKAFEPFLPYLTARKAGESFPGFEAGGPMEAIYKQAGLSYDPKQFAARPLTFNMEEQFGDLSGVKVPDPGKIFPKEFSLPTPTSATAQGLPEASDLARGLVPSAFAPNSQESQALADQLKPR